MISYCDTHTQTLTHTQAEGDLLFRYDDAPSLLFFLLLLLLLSLFSHPSFFSLAPPHAGAFVTSPPPPPPPLLFHHTSLLPPSLHSHSLPLSLSAGLLLPLNGNTHRCVKGRSNSTYPPAAAAAASPTPFSQDKRTDQGTDYYFVDNCSGLKQKRAQAWKPTCLNPVRSDRPAGLRSSSSPARL